jgi:ParB-like chromosome segregation protein Spo0J
MKKKVIEVDLERIRPNLRLVYHRESLEMLCRFILSRGQVDPIQVWFDGECFRIWDGEKRWRVCKMLGITRVRVILIEFVEGQIFSGLLE